MSLVWERVDADWPHKKGEVRPDEVVRTAVPGGWLVFVYGYADTAVLDFGRGVPTGREGGYGFGGLTFYPDPEHEWDGDSLE